MPRYVLHHRHEPHECGVVFASFKGHESRLRRKADARLLPLRRARDLVDGGRASEAEALALLPFYVAERTIATSVSEVEIP